MKAMFKVKVATVSLGIFVKKGRVKVYTDRFEFRGGKSTVIPFSSIVNVDEDRLGRNKKYKLHLTGGSEFTFSTDTIDARKRDALETVLNFVLAKEEVPEFDPYDINLPEPPKAALAKKRSGGTVFQGGERM